MCLVKYKVCEFCINFLLFNIICSEGSCFAHLLLLKLSSLIIINISGSVGTLCAHNTEENKINTKINSIFIRFINFDFFPCKIHCY